MVSDAIVAIQHISVNFPIRHRVSSLPVNADIRSEIVSLDLFLLSLHFTADPAANRQLLRAKKMKNAQKIDDDEYDDDSDVDEEDPFAGGNSSDDPDFLGDMSSDDDDEESGKDSGHESSGTESVAD